MARITLAVGSFYIGERPDIQAKRSVFCRQVFIKIIQHDILISSQGSDQFRLVAGRNTVISSNLTLEEAARRYSPQIASRLEGEYHVLHFFGDDIRLLKKNRM